MLYIQHYIQGRINHLVDPTHSTAPGPHWNVQRLKGKEGWLSPTN